MTSLTAYSHGLFMFWIKFLYAFLIRSEGKDRFRLLWKLPENSDKPVTSRKAECFPPSVPGPYWIQRCTYRRLQHWQTICSRRKGRCQTDTHRMAICYKGRPLTHFRHRCQNLPALTVIASTNCSFQEDVPIRIDAFALWTSLSTVFWNRKMCFFRETVVEDTLVRQDTIKERQPWRAVCHSAQIHGIRDSNMNLMLQNWAELRIAQSNSQII